VFNDRTVGSVTVHQLGLSTGLTGLTSTLSAITDDLKRVGAVGLSSVRGATDSTAQLTIRVPK
jgi:hypothetical protein